VVHLSSYRTEKTAKVEMGGLRKHGYEAGYELTNLGEKGMWYRVFAGPFATREAAEAARVALLKFPEYHYAQVRRVPRD
jgi:cell division septation protein DedD